MMFIIKYLVDNYYMNWRKIKTSAEQAKSDKSGGCHSETWCLTKECDSQDLLLTNKHFSCGW